MPLIFFMIHIIVLIWLWTGYLKALHKKQKQNTVDKSNFPDFTILIAARNEEENLPGLLKDLKQQHIDWNRGKIILVLDRCQDNSLQIAARHQAEMPYLKIIDHQQDPGKNSPKKEALIRGLEDISTAIVIQSDADVILPPQWIHSHLELHDRETAAVFGMFDVKLPGNLWGKWLWAEKLWTFFISLGSFGWGAPFLAFGGNISFNLGKIDYRQQLQKFRNSLSGDDDLVIQTLKASHLKSEFIYKFSFFPVTRLPANIKSFFHQRKRHLSAGHRFSFPAKLFYGFFTGSWSFFLFTLPFFPQYIYLFLLKTILDFILLFVLSKRFSHPFGLIHIILLEIFYIPYLWITGALSVLQKITWK